jgi:hypothetical protein
MLKLAEPLFSSHMIDLSEEPVEWNIQTTAKYLKRMAPMKRMYPGGVSVGNLQRRKIRLERQGPLYLRLFPTHSH